VTGVLAFTFLARSHLWWLLAVFALGGIYIAIQAQRRPYTVRFTNLDLLDTVAPKRPGWRRHLPAAAFVLGGLLLVIAFARPSHAERVPRERATIVLAVDVSLSMQADDVAPTRLVAAQQAAKTFLDEVPDTINVGLVSFSGTVSVLVAPTTDRQLVRDAIDNLQLQEGTAIGSAIVASLDAINQAPPPADGTEPAPGRIVLMSDGKTTVGLPNEEGVAAANAAEVPVTTIAFGTDEGTITVEGEPSPIPVPVNRDALRAIADQTGGTYFEAFTERDLAAIYRDIGSSVGYKTEQREVGAWFLGTGLLLLLLAAAGSLLWSSRLP
jgi:Ca-activated chloride channel family protein